MALPKIDAPTYELTLPLSKKTIRFRPFLVKEQKNLMMAMESDDSETIERNVRQVLTNCTITDNIDIDKLPVIDVEFYFLHLRARSVGEVVENNYVCTNQVHGEQCGNKMKSSFNILDVQVEMNPDATVRSVRVVDEARMMTDSFFRAAAESALRAVRNPSCNPLRLPADKFETWKSFTLNFNPKEML